jgi:hypothetical protein
LAEVNCNNALLTGIIKEWGCFARQKTRFTAETQRTQRRTVVKGKERKQATRFTAYFINNLP